MTFGNARPPAEHEIRVLIINDNESVRNVLGEVVSTLGYRVFTAANGVQYI